MTITEYFECYKTAAGKKKIEYPIKLSAGSAKSLSELYENCIKEHINFQANAIAWHKMLLRYIELPDAVFWVRRYESSSKNQKAIHGGRWPTRRACKTEYDDGFSYVFVSNFDAHEIFNMVRLGVVPDENEFLKLMKDHQFPLHYDSGKSCEESDIASYPKIGSTRAGALTVNHWYLAHILGVNQGDDYTCPVDFEKICPRGELSDWKKHSGFMVRKITDRILTPQEKNLIKAHFLRFVDPLNYYVIPGKNYQDNHGYHFRNNQIGEYAVLNDYISQKFAHSSMYGREIVEEFRNVVFAKPLKAAGDEVIDITYGPIPKSVKSKTGTKKAASSKGRSGKRSYDEKLELAAYYMRHDIGLIDLEKEKLSYNANGTPAKSYSGSRAKAILNALDVTTAEPGGQKGLLIRSDIATEIDKATGEFKKTLEEIKKRGL